MTFSDEERESFVRLMRWRRDVRHFETTPIEPAITAQLQLAMEMAPSVGNARPWRVFQVESAAKRQAVHRNFLQANAAALAVQAPQRQHQYAQLKLEGIERAPLQLAIFTNTNPSEGHGLGRHSIAVSLQHSTAMAVQNLNLLARAHGLGVGMVTVLDAAAMASLFEVPAEWQFSLYLCIGVPQFTDDLPLLHRKNWQENVLHPWQVC
ncbi:5,6-dimethylbenzimidazole synthase [Lampropedia puyangensis]|uniref:5,6-dimethylbenzimidazole synthase n=1 Tax=Lampropedia puyangensis TaxID=1330072 RepID=A0A4S8EXN4_9BURK|nr:5,6-dimethylbenzimidazole synthase [Lampropedia puyangensis]THT97451.1 5,6-dimethylbenzimidazole synthase [Lampropedia puyangensis]